MAERLADIVAQIQNVRQLGAVVTAMRGIAASRAQNGRSLLAGIDAYSNVVSRAIGEALDWLPTDVAAPASGRAFQTRPHSLLRRARFRRRFQRARIRGRGKRPRSGHESWSSARVAQLSQASEELSSIGRRRCRRRSTGFRVSQTSSLMCCMATSPRAPSRRPISSSRVRPPAAAFASTGTHSCRSTSSALRAGLTGSVR